MEFFTPLGIYRDIIFCKRFSLGLYNCFEYFRKFSISITKHPCKYARFFLYTLLKFILTLVLDRFPVQTPLLAT